MNQSLACFIHSLPALAFLSVASGQVPTRLITQGAALPGGNPGEVIDGLHVVAADRAGSVVFLLDTSETPSSGSYLVWGSLEGAPFGVLRRPDPAANGITEYRAAEIAVQQSELAHMPLVGATQEIRIDDRTVWTAGAPTLHAPGVWAATAADVGLTSTGEPYAFARWVDPVNGAPLGEGIFLGDPLQPLIVSGDVIPGLADPIQSIWPGQFDVSEDGSHYIGIMRLNCPSCDGFFERFAAVVDGQPVMVGGAPLRGEQPVPAAVGGTGELWWDMTDSGITNDGRSFVAGTTFRSGQSAEDYILRDGEFWLRTGDAIEAGTWIKSFGAVLTEDGLLVHISTYIDQAGAVRTGVFVEKRVLHSGGDSVDWNRNGSADAGFETMNFWVSNRSVDVSAVTDDCIYYRASVRVPSGQIGRGYFKLPYRVGQNYCDALPNSTGVPARMVAFGTSEAAANELSLVANHVPSGAFGYFITGDLQASVPMAGGSSGVLCVGGSLGRFVGPGQIQAATAGRALYIDLDLSDHPQANGPITVTAGQTWNYSAWFRDSTSQGGATSNFADGLAIQFR